MRAPAGLVLISLSAALPILAGASAEARRSEQPLPPRPVQSPAHAKPAANPQANLHASPALEPKPSLAAHPLLPAGAPEGPLKITDAALEPAEWGELDGWLGDDHARAFATFQASCRPMVRTKAITDTRPVRAALQTVCGRAIAAGPLDRAAARRFFEANFLPIRIRKLSDTAGFLTGYYEPIFEGSRFPTREFTVPLYRRPPDLVAAGATGPGGPFPNSGRAFRQTASGELVPYYDRGEIEDGALDGQRLEICWLRNATEALIAGIEGSARIRLEDGTILRLNYDAHNGYPYVAVGRVLIERNLVPREEMSLQRIRDWMRDNPDDAKEVRRQNRSMVFFRIVGLNDDREAIGAQGIPLSAGRSIAVDKVLHVYGTPFFIEADLPLDARGNWAFRRTMIAQDTGSAITGPARADLYFGTGDEAGQVAGRIRQAGRFAMLVPRALDPVAAGARMPLPPLKPPLPPPPAARLTAHDKPEAAAKAQASAPAPPAPVPHLELRPARRPVR